VSVKSSKSSQESSINIEIEAGFRYSQPGLLKILLNLHQSGQLSSFCLKKHKTHLKIDIKIRGRVSFGKVQISAQNKYQNSLEGFV
jgi:hypothetical protein